MAISLNTVALGINMVMYWNMAVAGKSMVQKRYKTLQLFITHSKNMQSASHNSSLQLHNSLHCSFSHTARL